MQITAVCTSPMIEKQISMRLLMMRSRLS